MMIRYGKGATKRTDRQQVELAVRLLDNRHAQDVIDRAPDLLGSRAKSIGPVDMGFNLLLRWVNRTARAYDLPAFVSGLTPELAAVLDDASASTTIAKYGAAGGHPLPTALSAASLDALRYELGCGYSGLLLGVSPRRRVLTYELITPDDLTLEYGSDDPDEPTIIRQRGVRTIGGEAKTVSEVYDLTDLDAPSYRIYDGSRDVTEAVLGETYEGEGYTRYWSYADGRPFHRIVVRGHPRRVFARLQQVEATLIAQVRWTAWGSGTDHCSHPGRNVRDLDLVGQESDDEDGAPGFADGPEVIKRWTSTNPDRPGEHWQDAPAFDPLTTAKAIGYYVTLSLSTMDLPSQMESTGGEPTARELEMLDVRIRSTYPGCRRFDSELLGRSAAIANRTPIVPGDGYAEEGYGLLYGEEIAEEISPGDTGGDTGSETGGDTTT